MLCIAAISVTFSYVDFAEARSYDSEEAFLEKNTQKVKKSNHKKKRHRKKNKSDKRKNNRKIEQEEPSEQRSDDYDTRSDNQNTEDETYSKAERKRLRKQKKKLKAQKKRDDNIKNQRSDEERDSKRKKRKKRKKSRKNKNYSIQSNIERYDYNEKSNDADRKKSRNIETRLNSEENYMENDEVNWKDIKPKTNKDGEVIDPAVNSSIDRMYLSMKEPPKEKSPEIRMTKGLTKHNDLVKSITARPKQNYKIGRNGPKEPIKLRQELERYKRILATSPTLDETA